MVKKSELNEDQQVSFDQMISSGHSEEEALEVIQEMCVEEGYTGLRVERFKFTPRGLRRARELAGI